MRTIIATGGHSGLGFAAITALIKSPPQSLPPPYHLVLFARNAADHHAVRAVDELSANALASAPGSKIELRSMDLANLPSVRSAARQLREELSSRKQRVDVLFLNAAVAKAQREIVQDSGHQPPGKKVVLTDANGHYETTACVNHVAHLVLIKELLPHLREQPPASADSPQKALRIVFTGSALHRSIRDPSELDKWFSPESAPKEWSLRTTYAASKFLQLLGVQGLQRRLRSVPSLGETEVVIVQPGFVPQTSLNRESGTFARFIMGYLFPVLPFGFIESVDGAANTMAQAVSRPLSFFEADEKGKGRDGKPLSPIGGDEAWIPPHLRDDAVAQGSDHVQAALIARGGILQRPDDRSRDVELQDKWWPSAADW